VHVSIESRRRKNLELLLPSIPFALRNFPRNEDKCFCRKETALHDQSKCRCVMVCIARYQMKYSSRLAIFGICTAERADGRRLGRVNEVGSTGILDQLIKGTTARDDEGVCRLGSLPLPSRSPVVLCRYFSITSMKMSYILRNALLCAEGRRCARERRSFLCANQGFDLK
jgi:hypothetical protein